MANVLFHLGIGKLLRIEIYLHGVVLAQVNTNDSVRRQHLLFDIYVLTRIRHDSTVALDSGTHNELWSYI